MTWHALCIRPYVLPVPRTRTVAAPAREMHFTTQKNVKGNANKELLFELVCQPEHVQRCPALGVGPTRTTVTSTVEYVTKGALTERQGLTLVYISAQPEPLRFCRR
jgi:hypothetical protein